MKSFVGPEEMEYQRACIARVAALHEGGTACVRTFGCQQNEADSERMRGMLKEMGYRLTDSDGADVLVLNTCAVRENAEKRVFGNVGRLVHTKRQNPNQIIILAGCMAGEEPVRERIRKSYRHVDALLDTTTFWRLPEYLLRIKEGSFEDTLYGGEPDSRIAEGLPVNRTEAHKAWVSVMYGCNNFCSYCIVPHVRGRERSRRSGDILREIAGLVRDGCKEVTLLGQNVNSYGKDLEGETDFAGLLEQAAQIEGDFWIRFMTSHPKDATHRLVDVMSANPKIERHLHLPVQSGSNRILEQMNRKYTREQYLDLVRYARAQIPEIVFTSDVIVGFPGETEADFEQTISLIREVGYEGLFTFIYSRRSGTPAAEMEDPTSTAAKRARFNRLLDEQNAISLEKHRAYPGRTLRVLVDGESRENRHNLTARTNSGRLVCLMGSPELIGTFQLVRITEANTWSLVGELEAGQA